MSTTPTSADDRSEWAMQVAQCVAQLPRAQAQTLRLLYFEGRNVGEVAQLTELSIREVASTAFDALVRIGETVLRYPL